MPQCTDILNTLAPCLAANGMDDNLAQVISFLLGTVLVVTIPLALVIFIIWVDRKVSARIQDRIGPNRVGPFGLLQNVADAIKLIGKEDITPSGADRTLYNAAPILAMVSVLLIWVAIPFTPLHIAADLEIGMLYFLGVSSLGTLAIMMAGWSSNNKYSLLGAFRSIALLVSYEVPLALALLVPVMLTGSMRIQEIVQAQGGAWYLFTAPIAAMLFFISNLAETGRAPFDLIEAESEIVAGYNIEYSGMKFGLFMAYEFLHFFTVQVVFVVFFMGGWWGPGVEQFPILGVVYLALKTAAVYLLGMLIRYSLPRLRIDQVMRFNWFFMVPVAIIQLLLIAFVLKLVQTLGIAPAPGADFIAHLPQTVILLAANLALMLVIVGRIRKAGQRARLADTAAPPESGVQSTQRAEVRELRTEQKAV